MKQLTLLLGVLFFSTISFAVVDMKNANYSSTWVDLQIPGSGFDLKIVRTYNSRSLYSSIFGFGMCSDFETKLDLLPEGGIQVTECGGGQEVLYHTKQTGKKEIEKTVSSILTAMKTSKKFDDKKLKQLEKEMLADQTVRTQYASEFKIAASVKEGSTLYSGDRELDNILVTKEGYTRNLADGSSQKFTKDGKMLNWYDKNSNYIKFEWDKDKLKEVVDNNGRRLTFKWYDAAKKVKSVQGPDGIEVEYKYGSNNDDLVWVKNQWKNTYTYEYDELHNMTKAGYPDGTFVALTYDTKRDWVTSFVDREKCKETYKYEFDEKAPDDHYWSTVEKVCGKEVTNNSRHEFWYKTNSSGLKVMQKVSSVVNGDSTEIEYHEQFGRPTKIRRNGETYEYTYYPNGQAKTKKGTYTFLTYTYDPKSKKVSKLDSISYDGKGKKTGTRTYSFKYDGKGNLIYADNSSGQKVNMSYDNKGRITSILDQAKKTVKIEYEERYGKPAKVTRPGLGTIKVSYKTGGDIDKVESPEGPDIALQVASTFNNYLDIIAPASAEIYSN